MAFSDLREWIAAIEKREQLVTIRNQVDWNEEIGALTRLTGEKAGPALLFENIKDYEKGRCTRVFTNGLASPGRVALALGLPENSTDREITVGMKDKFRLRIPPTVVESGPVKENIVKGEEVNLYDFPVPLWNAEDGGRYINTMCGIVTKDPDTGLMNIGMYRGMITGKNTIGVLLAMSQHWGHHFAKYRARGEEMPVAVVYGWDPTLFIAASTPVFHPDCSEYEITGGLRGESVPLVKCETSDLMVPAGAEIVVEGFISADPGTFIQEGPFAEYTGYYAGESTPKHVIRVECITHRNDAIFAGTVEGGIPGKLVEPYYWMAYSKCAVVWDYLEKSGVPNILGVWNKPVSRCTNVRVQIKTAYRGHAQQVAHCIWGSTLMNYTGKMVTVVDEDIDVYSDDAVDWALAYRLNADMGDIMICHGSIGSMLDPSVPLDLRNSVKYGMGKWAPVLLDATINWELEIQPQYGNKRYPSVSSIISEQARELVTRRWKEYGLE
ncbi:MAG: UbiD family decarboxylase [Thermincola sp.]|jgi:4-hydroxy-3-polyprenylbenzoate decarboxylase|nr:UbiD family decarboxylase [Thermincola sp.]MDT3701438.1 UbiD family decarboxylase [Thermincola sp.]